MRNRLLICFVLFLNLSVFSQFKNDLQNNDNNISSIYKSEPTLYLGFFNPENFSMKHSYSLVYSNFGVNSIGLGIYTNSMSYKFTDNLNAKVDISVVHSPFGSYSKGVSDKFNGIYISRADLNYKISDNFLVQLKYRQLPSYSLYGISPFQNYYDPIFGSRYNDDFDFRR